MYETTCSRLKLTSVLGITISLSWMLQVGHHVSTRGAPVPVNPATVFPPIWPDDLVSPERYWMTPQQYAGPAKTLKRAPRRPSTSRHNSAMCGVLSTLQPKYMTISGAGPDSCPVARVK